MAIPISQKTDSGKMSDVPHAVVIGNLNPAWRAGKAWNLDHCTGLFPQGATPMAVPSVEAEENNSHL